MNDLTRHVSQVEADVALYRLVRAVMPGLAAALSAEDLAAQAMPDASPGKWHLAHTSWFFEAMILAAQPGYEPVDLRLQQIFNSYYEALGARVERHERGLMTRPSLDECLAYRAEIDRRMIDRLRQGVTSGAERYLLRLGLNHDQQHQELFLMDILALMARSPLDPAAYETEPRRSSQQAPLGGVEAFDGGLVEIGHGGPGFAFDNESPRHRVWLEPFALARDLVTNGEWIAFMDDEGYARPEFWLADGWARVQAEGWTAPLYWRAEAEGWTTQTLTGRQPVDPSAPVRHISAFEAEAFAAWASKRLPTEAEWEHAATVRPEAFSNLFGEVWQHTASAYSPYPGFSPTPGTAAEYNGKFMSGQTVLRGSSFATPEGHERVSYRNFFYPFQRWAFMGLRLAEDRAQRVADHDEDAAVAAFRKDFLEGMRKPQKAVSPKWFYDAEGSRLFEEITEAPEYYPTRQETALLTAMAADLAGRFGDNAVLVELGSGASEKTRILLNAAPNLAAYIPIDISPDALNEAAARISAAYPALEVAPVVGDFLDLPALPELGRGRRIGFFPGSTVGNLDQEAAVGLLKVVRERLGPGSLFILGVDLIKDPAVLVAAYDDAAGVTAAFNKNLLVRANRELSADFDVEAFQHSAVWNPAESRMEMHLVSMVDQQVRIGSETVRFMAGETIHTESSRKYREASVRAMAEAAGWTLETFQAGPAPSVALAVLKA